MINDLFERFEYDLNLHWKFAVLCSRENNHSWFGAMLLICNDTINPIKNFIDFCICSIYVYMFKL
jgi:hypothetical protein